ncbi:TnsD family Tn7-like transposition protein [Paraburkholderia nemoris]|uniref:TnsD family Tn7-like transposition protein n=1 Tax=Paraburkholderia nemoris TaxID=2793076 RepID=UPI0038B754F7
MAIALFPLHEGETIGSNLGRYGEFIGLENTLVLRRRLFGHTCKPDVKLPSGINHLAEEAGDYWNLDAEGIIKGHTEFNYATLTVSESQRKEMFSDMLDQPAGRCARRSACGWAGECVTRFRYCEDCLLEWRAKKLPSHWLVDHQLPGVYFCCVHSCMLKMTKGMSFENLTDPTVMALKGAADEQILTRTSFFERSAIEDVARRSARYRMANGTIPLASTYRELLQDAGFVWPSGRMNDRAFIASFLAHFGKEYCRLAGLNWQKMTVWLRNIVDRERGGKPSHPFMFIAVESLLNRRCASPGSFVPATQGRVIELSTESSESPDGTVDQSIQKLSCVGILHRNNDMWRECAREGSGWKLVCSCGVSYQASDVSQCGKAKVTVKAYGWRYQSLIAMRLADGVSVGAMSQESYMKNANFLRWARNAGFSKDKGFSKDEIQDLRGRWCSLVQNARPAKRITSAYRVDSKLYRTLCRYDREWFAAFNLANRTRPKRSCTARRAESTSH